MYASKWIHVNSSNVNKHVMIDVIEISRDIIYEGISGIIMSATVRHAGDAYELAIESGDSDIAHSCSTDDTFRSVPGTPPMTKEAARPTSSLRYVGAYVEQTFKLCFGGHKLSRTSSRIGTIRHSRWSSVTQNDEGYR